jgi:hypothetical protein
VCAACNDDERDEEGRDTHREGIERKERNCGRTTSASDIGYGISDLDIR